LRNAKYALHHPSGFHRRMNHVLRFIGDDIYFFLDRAFN
jgi:hypothetical protein